ncbi:hypothetical protein VYU27_000736 [Nannochloropsis oceanica]
MDDLNPFRAQRRLARTPPLKPKVPVAAVEAPPLWPKVQSPPAQNMHHFVPKGPAITTQHHQQPRMVHSPPFLAAQQQQQKVVRSPPVPTLARLAARLAAATEAPVAARMSSLLETPELAPSAVTAAYEKNETAAAESPGSLRTTTTKIVTKTAILGEAQASGTPPLVETQAAAPAPLPEHINLATPTTTTAVTAMSDTTVDPKQAQDVSSVVTSNEANSPLPQYSVAEPMVSVQSTEELVVKEPPSLEVQKKVNFVEAALPVAKAQHEWQQHHQQQEQRSEHDVSATTFVTPSVEKALPSSPPAVSSPPVSAAFQRPAYPMPAMPAVAPWTAPDPPSRDAPSARSLITNILSSASSFSRAPIRTTTAASTTCIATVSPRMAEQPLGAKVSAPAPGISTKTVSQPSPSLPAAQVAFSIRNFTQSLKKGPPIAEIKPVVVTVDLTSTQATVKSMEEQEEDALDAPIAMVDMSSSVQSAEGKAMATTSALPAVLTFMPSAPASVPAAAPVSAAAQTEVVVKETPEEEDLVTAAKATLTQQEAELQDELARLRAELMQQKAESQRLMESWTQAQEALNESGAELNGVQRERRRLSVDVSRLTQNLTTTEERIPLLLEETDKVRMEAHRIKMEQLKERCELTASVRAFDRLCELERRLKIKLVHQEAASYDARSTYLRDYRTMCSFGRTVSLKAFELMGRVKEGVGRVKGAMQVQRGELQKQAAEASQQAAHASKVSAAEIIHLANREVDQQKTLQKVEEGKKKAEKRLVEAEKRASEEVRRLESMVSSRGNEIKKLEDELKKLRRDGSKRAALAAKAAKAVVSNKMKAAQKTVKKAEEKTEEEDREEDEQQQQQQHEEEREEPEDEDVPLVATKAKGSRKRTTSKARLEKASAPKKIAPRRQPKNRAAVRSAPVSQRQDVEAEQVEAVKTTPVVATMVTAHSSSSSSGLPFSFAEAVDAIPDVMEAHADKDVEEEVLPVSKRAAFRASTNKRVMQEMQSEEQTTQASENSPAAPSYVKRSRGASLSEPVQELTAMASPQAPAVTTIKSLRRRSSRNKNDLPVALHAAAAPPLGEQSKNAVNEQAQVPTFAPVTMKKPAAVVKAPSAGPSAAPCTTSMTTIKPAAKSSTLKHSQGSKKNTIFSTFINKGAIPKLKKQT